jgi:hypothetical protein
MLAWLLVIGLLVVVAVLACDVEHWRKECQSLQTEHQRRLEHQSKEYQSLQAEYQEAARHGADRLKAAEATPTVPAEKSGANRPSSSPARSTQQSRRDVSQCEYYDRLNQLGFCSRDDYQKSEHWQGVKSRYRESDYPQRCLVCGSRDFVLHHRSYARLGEEQLFDLVPLCQHHHEQLHELLDSDPERSVKDTHDYLVLLVDKGQVGREEQRCRVRRFRKVVEYKERFRSLPAEVLQSRLKEFGGVLQQEAVIALRELLEERERTPE